MKKLFTTMVLMLALVIVGKAQTPLLSENFNSGIPTGWTTIDADGDGYNWADLNLPGPGHSENSDDVAISSQSYTSSAGPLTPDNWLITPAISIPASGVYELTFWVCAQDASWPQEHYGVYITTNTTGYDNPANYTLLFEETLDANGGLRAQGAWKMKSQLLQNYAGQTVHIAFRHFNCTDMFVLNLDDVTVDIASTEPNVMVSATSFQFTGGAVGSNFGRKQFSVSGVNLTDNVVLSLPTNTPFGISTDTVNYGNSITLTPNANGSVNGVIYVVFNPTAIGHYTSNIAITSQIGTKNVALEGLAIDCSQNQTLPWYETFATEDFPSNCWTMTSTDTNDYVQDGQVYPGYKYYTWFNSITNQYASVRGDENAVQDEHLYSPTFDLSNATGAADFQFNFRTNPNIDALINGQVRFKVNISTNNGASWTTIFDVADIRADFSAYWSSWDDIWPVSINMDQYLGSNAQIKFDFHYEADLGAADQVIIQNVKFTNYQDPRMTAEVEDTVTFFTYVGNPEAIVIPVNARNLSAAVNINTTAPFEVSTNGTTYATTATLAGSGNVYVRYNPSNNSSDVATVTLSSNYTDATHTYPDTTLTISFVAVGNSYNCSVINLPIEESFESEEGTVLAPNSTEYCWGAIKGNVDDPQNEIINSNDYAYAGTQSFRFSSTKYNAQQMYDQYLISPELNSTNPMVVMFRYANASVLKDETFRVGYSTTGNAIEDFTWEADIVNEANTDWHLYRNTNVPANTKYVAVHYKSQYKAYLYIDKFEVMEVSNCMFPVELRAENTGTDYADLMWTAGANETSWEMVYGVAPLNVSMATPTTVTTLGTTINGLTANTHYQVAVRAICGADENSSWSEVADFWTTTTPATVPYTQTFEENDADRANWVLFNNGQPNYFMYGNIPGSTTGKALMITQDGQTNTYLTQVGETMTSHYSTVWAYRDIQFPETEAYGFKLSLNWKCFGEVDYDFGELFIGNATGLTNFDRNENHPGFVDVNTAHYTPTGLTKIDRFVNKAQTQTAAYIIPAEDVAGKVKRLYFLWTNDSLSGAETPLAIDNINISIPQFSNMSGLVTDADNGSPIANATVSVVSNEGFTGSATTDNNGNYLIENLVAGYYSITVTAHGYQTLSTGYSLAGGDNNVPFELSVEECVIIPTGLTYVIEDVNMVLTWDAIEGGAMSQATGTTVTGNLGVSAETYRMGAYHLFKQEHLARYNGCTIDNVSFRFNSEPSYCTYTIRIYIGNDPAGEFGPAALLYERQIDPSEILDLNSWNTYAIDPFVVDATQPLWIGYHAAWENVPESSSSNRYPCSYLNSLNDGYGNVLFFNDEWQTSGTDFGDWAIRANAIAPDLHYNILEDGQVIASNLEEAEYVVSPYSSNSCYQVVTICENGEVSSPSECAGEDAINDVNANISFEVYPNPAHETVTVSTTMNAQKVEVLNYLGQVIYSHNVTGNNFTLNVANYADGVYFIRLTGDEGIATQKLIKK